MNNRERRHRSATWRRFGIPGLGMALLCWSLWFVMGGCSPTPSGTENPSQEKSEVDAGGGNDQGKTPDTTKPETRTSPDTTQPDTTQPDTAKPDTTQPDTTQPDGSKAYGLTKREVNTTCKLPGKPTALTSMATERAFPNLPGLERPLFLTYPPGDTTKRLFVLEQGGRIKLFNNDRSARQVKTFLDIRSKIRWPCRGCSNRGGNEEGLLGMAFHPNYTKNGYFYVYYTNNYRSSRDRRTILARYKVSANDPDKADPNSETILMRTVQTYSNHNGGQIEFGPDGYLYITVGDGGSAGDPGNNGQNLKTLMGSILRIDVDRKDPGLAYAIPKDNPFFGRRDGTRGEIWAYGLRNVWRFSFDRLSGTMWAGDVGQNAQEEIDIIVKGGNYGWKLMEGTNCYRPRTGCNPRKDLVLPIVTHNRSEARSITGGYVYRGKRLPQLYGAYIYADFVTGNIWGLRYDGKTVTENPLLVRSNLPVASFGEDRAGEVYIVAFDGRIYRLKSNAAPSPSKFPLKISETGCFSSLKPLAPAKGLIPYTVNIPLWADNVDKRRWIALPGQQKIKWDAQNAWNFPDDTVIVKHFSINRTKGDDKSVRHIETRFMVKTKGDWRGYTYVWNESQTEAFLLDGEAQRRITQTDPKNSANNLNFPYTVPSRANCLQCHTPQAGYVLGLKTGQMNKTHRYPSGISDNQLRTLNHIQLFDKALTQAPSALLKFPAITDSQVPLDKRARAYLDASCAYCHRPGVPGTADTDLRDQTPFKDTRTCGETPSKGDMGVSGSKIVDPGKPDRSVLYLRMNTRTAKKMPNLGTELIHKDATGLIRAWIQGLKSCP